MHAHSATKDNGSCCILRGSLCAGSFHDGIKRIGEDVPEVCLSERGDALDMQGVGGSERRSDRRKAWWFVMEGNVIVQRREQSLKIFGRKPSLFAW